MRITARLAVGVGVIALLTGALAGCDAEPSRADPADRATSSATSRTVLSAEDVTNAPALREGRGYTTVVDPPSMIGARVTLFLGMISPTEVFGTVRQPSDDVAGGGDVVVYDTASGEARTLDTLAKDSQVVGMTFSDRYVAWSEVPTTGATSGPWTIRVLDRASGAVRTVASASDVGEGEPSLADPEGGIPRISGDEVIFVAGDSDMLPTAATAYRVPLDGSSKPRAIAADVQAAYPSGDRIVVSRDGQLSMLDLAGGKEAPVRPHRGGECAGFAAQGVYVQCDETRGAPRLTIVQPGGGVVEIHLPDAKGGAATEGPAYLGASTDWITFTYDDKAYVLDLESKKLGRFPGAQYVSGEQSFGDTIGYFRMRTSGSDAEPAPFVKLELG